MVAITNYILKKFKLVAILSKIVYAILPSPKSHRSIRHAFDSCKKYAGF